MSDCIEWHGRPTQNGYARTTIGKRKKLLHRHAWECVNGPIPDGLFILHRCDNRMCYNVEHLFIGTHADNMRDMKEKGRRKGKNKQDGESNPGAKLTARVVHEIRVGRQLGVPQEALAALFAISQSHVSMIEHGKLWVSK